MVRVYGPLRLQLLYENTSGDRKNLLEAILVQVEMLCVFQT
jgi:hypothetical protein